MPGSPCTGRAFSGPATACACAIDADNNVSNATTSSLNLIVAPSNLSTIPFFKTTITRPPRDQITRLKASAALLLRRGELLKERLGLFERDAGIGDALS